MIPSLRIFLSSPGDVSATREIAALTIERLAQDYARHMRIEPYLWEYEAMVASGHFQDSIEPPSANHPQSTKRNCQQNGLKYQYPVGKAARFQS